MTTELQVAREALVRNPLDEAASMLTGLCEEIEAGADPEGRVGDAFGHALADVRRAVDIRVAFASWVSGQIAAAKVSQALWAARIKLLKRVEDSFFARLVLTAKANPDIPLKGSLGSLRLKKNPPAVALNPEVGGELSPEKIKAFKIPKAWIIRRTVKTVTLDTDAVRKALKDDPEKWKRFGVVTQGERVDIGPA